MNKDLHDLLSRLRESSRTEREKGEYFELLICNYLKKDPVYSDQYSDAWPYEVWAGMHGLDKRDTGIDLVAKPRDEEGFCAVQCKFYAEDYPIAKSDINSFFTAYGKIHFTQGLIVDTTRKAWTDNAEGALLKQTKPVHRLGLVDLEQSPIDWRIYASNEKVVLKDKKSLKEHQRKALEKVQTGLEEADRGKLIMACGTGKTFTSLRIAEALAGKGKQVLYLVPSLSLMSQTVREWTNDAEVPLRSFAVCSDAHVGKRKARDDLSDINIHDLAYPATTDPSKLAVKLESTGGQSEKMTVIFSTYNSIQVISDAQNNYNVPDFDFIVCDEAHRTTGVTLVGEDESNFVKVHDQKFIRGKKRLYMTATPRIYSGVVKNKAIETDAVLCSMDKTAQYGDTLYELTFSYAVDQGLLTDYKVIVLAVDEELVSTGVQKRLTDANSELVLDDATKIIGCYRALAKLDMTESQPTGGEPATESNNFVNGDRAPMKRAVSFCRRIYKSKLIKDEFSRVVDEYQSKYDSDNRAKLQCSVEHVDGTFNAKERTRLLDWLGEDTDPDQCRILTNARCLSEGVDVPALDAIMFLHPRKSQIDVVQSVGRVMRTSPGKKMGYVILPVGIPVGMSAEEALNNNEKYRVVWQILNALRSHDDSFDSLINKIEYGVDYGKKIQVVVHQLPKKANEPTSDVGGDGHESSNNDYDRDGDAELSSTQTRLELDEFSKAILARIVRKCGTRDYWEDWAGDIGKIAKTHITRITALLNQSDTQERKVFDTFLEEIRDDLNKNITETDAIEMLAQHIITRPVFEALFKDYSFAENNPVSIAMQNILDLLQTQNLDNENRSLEKFYANVRMRAEGIDNDVARQKIIVHLYDHFFKKAFPHMTKRLGIVYTPVEVVDFIIHSVDELLRKEFNKSLSSKGIHILDPFTGTGTFVTRLLQSGLIEPGAFAYKYRHEIHANEIILLAYYIAAINIEAAYHGQEGGRYEPFNGICLTDTFQMYERDDLVSFHMQDNSERRKRQKAQDIRVVLSNPPYSAKQGRANDNNANVRYTQLDERITTSYVKHTTSGNVNSLYDSYIRSFRWATDLISDEGIIAYVSNGGWLDDASKDGFRRCLEAEFSRIYCFNLRGNQRTAGELSHKEGGKIFGSGSRAGITITFLVKKKNADGVCQIRYHDIGDYFDRKQKMDIIKGFGSIGNMEDLWRTIIPNSHNDWINKRDKSFEGFLPLGSKANKIKTGDEICVFGLRNRGAETCRDEWVYNFSKVSLDYNMRSTIAFYNSEIERFRRACEEKNDSGISDVEGFINRDSERISWSSSLISHLGRMRTGNYDSDNIRMSVYRPFNKQHMYFDDVFIHRPAIARRFFPTPDTKNLTICVSGKGGKKDFSTFIVDIIPDLNCLDAGTQCFPRYRYDQSEEEKTQGSFEFEEADKRRSDNIPAGTIFLFQQKYSDNSIDADAIFYYVYGLLHSTDYKTQFSAELKKMLPRIPYVANKAFFWDFANAGKALSDIHIDYENQDPWPLTIREKNKEQDEKFRCRVKKLQFGVEEKEGKDKNTSKGKHQDKTVIEFNENITIEGIPLAAYDYIVNSKSAIEWVMECYQVKTYKESKIVNDPNKWSDDPRFTLELLQKVVTVSMKTVKIVSRLPGLEISQG